jgi:DUF3040 family protein
MLSEREQHVLSEIEQQIRGEDPQLAAAVQGLVPPRPARWVRLGHDVVILVALLSAALCLALSLSGATASAALLAAAAFYLHPDRAPLRGRPGKRRGRPRR